MFRQRVAKRHPAVQKIAETERWAVIPGAETSRSLAARVRAAIDRLAARTPTSGWRPSPTAA